MEVQPHVLSLGDNINTDDIIPAMRCTSTDPQHLARYALEYVVGEHGLQDYDVIEAGVNFGCGSSREHAPLALKAAGIRLVRARSFADIFYRNSINIGLRLELIGQSDSLDPVLQSVIDAGGLIPWNQQRLAGQRVVARSHTPPRAMTMAEKLLARASGNAFVQAGEVVLARVDLAMSHDAVTGPLARLFYQHFGEQAKVWDPQRLVLVADHFIQVNDIRHDPAAPLLHQQMRRFAEQQGCVLLDEVAPGEAAGICHVLLPEQGFIRPGMVIAGTDSHTCTYGAFGCFSVGVGTTDMANVLATGDMWVRVPETIVMELSGTLAPHVSAKDIMLFILGQIGCDGATGKVIEFCGPVVRALPIAERMTLANMAIECGARCGMISADQTTLDYLQQRNVIGQPDQLVDNDPGCEFARRYSFDLSDLRAQVACPTRPDRVASVQELAQVPITRAYIGSCTGGKLHDLAEAAAVLRGRRIAPGVNLFVAPASQDVRQQAEALGYLKIFADAGAEVLKSGCGACINAGLGGLGKQETGIYATNRNFKGRSGDPTAHHYLASPRVVAISAVRGWISDQLEP